MHEFSIIQNIVDLVTNSAMNHNVGHVSVVEVEVGKASGVEIDAMEFAWASFTHEGLLKDARLVIKEIPLEARCRSCDRFFLPTDQFEPCPYCAAMHPEIIKGRELRVMAIET